MKKLVNEKSMSENPLGQKLRNSLIAIVAIMLTVALVFGSRLQTERPSLATLAEGSVPLETALENGKPTFLEFYADWCVSCQTMAPAIGQLKSTYSDRLNFVMLNVDNDKWLPELLAYRVDGIPHFVYLSPDGTPLAQAIGEQPTEMITANLDALLANSPLPYAQGFAGNLSSLEPRLTLETPNADPRSHGG
jgi:thiol-disulfide isomerase/thioredoxin